MIDMLLLRQMARYCVTGGALTIVGYSAILLLTSIFGLNPFASNAIVYLVGIVASYWLNARVVFQNRLQLQSFLMFLASFLIAFAVNLLTLAVALHWMHWGHWLSQLVATAAYAGVHFLLSRAFVFRSQMH